MCSAASASVELKMSRVEQGFQRLHDDRIVEIDLAAVDFAFCGDLPGERKRTQPCLARDEQISVPSVSMPGNAAERIAQKNGCRQAPAQRGQADCLPRSSHNLGAAIARDEASEPTR